MPMKPEPKAPPVPPPQDNQQRRNSLAQSASATDKLRDEFQRQSTTRVDYGKDRRS